MHTSYILLIKIKQLLWSIKVSLRVVIGYAQDVVNPVMQLLSSRDCSSAMRGSREAHTELRSLWSHPGVQPALNNRWILRYCSFSGHGFVLPMFKVGLPNSLNQIQIILYRKAGGNGSLAYLDTVHLAVNITHHTLCTVAQMVSTGDSH